jgi:hypothetical protein
MDRFELTMHQRTLNQRWKGITHVKVFLPIAQNRVQLRERRRHVDSLLKRSAGGTDPVLAATKSSGSLFLAAHAFH